LRESLWVELSKTENPLVDESIKEDTLGLLVVQLGVCVICISDNIQGHEVLVEDHGRRGESTDHH
jgi:hypothetical protein